MTTLIGAFQNASAALHQNQLALNATADNIGNQNTAGYARKQVTWTAQDTVTLGSGESVRTPSAIVSSVRDRTLDRSVQQSQSASAAASSRNMALASLQSVFAIDASGQESSGVNDTLSQFFSAVSGVALSPSSSTARQTLYLAATSVVQAMHGTSESLIDQQSAIDLSVTDAISNVNRLASGIAALNGEIQRSTPGSPRDTLIDSRSTKLEELAKLIGFQQTDNGDGSVTLTVGSSGALVTGSSANAMSTAGAAGLHLIVGGSEITSELQGGSIGGMLSVRNGTLQNARDRLDALAAAFANAVNSINVNGRRADGSAGEPIFGVPQDASNAASAITLLASSGADFAAASSTEGGGGNSNANVMLTLQSQNKVAGSTFAEVLSELVNAIGTDAADAQDEATSTAATLTQSSAQRDAISGVSLDTEAANLTQYQRSYQAEAKLLSVLNEILANAINLGSNTTVS